MAQKEAQWQRGPFDAERLPKEIQDLVGQAIEKVATVYGIDLKSKPKRKVLCFERMALFVIAVPDSIIRAFLDNE